MRQQVDRQWTEQYRDAEGNACRSRRSFLMHTAWSVAALGIAGVLPSAVRAQAGDVEAMVLETVTGPVTGEDVEKALAHEHFFVDFHGPTDRHYMDVNWADAIGASVNAAGELRAQGVNLVIEWTNLGVGRNVLLLRHVSRETGMLIVCPTGIYKSLIPPAFEGLPVEDIAAHFVTELTKGIDGTAIRAGFIKIASTEAGPTASDTKIHRAAGIAAAETGATVTLHSPLAATTRAVLAVLEEEGFSPRRFVWGHAQPSNTQDHEAVAERGATIQFDAISADSDPFFQGPTDDASMLERIEELVDAGFENQVIVSADASVYVNPPKWQYDRDNTYVYRYFEAKLQERLGEAAAGKVLRDNVIRAFRRGDRVG